jgi:hypothetical protein
MIIRFAICFILGLPIFGAVIEGVVLENKSGKPLARTRVSIETVNGGSQPGPLYTDSNGNFRFTELSGGSYRLLAEKAGFVAARFGQSRHDSAGSPITLQANGQFFAEMRLVRPGAITGAVLDENGIGMPGFSVSAYRAGTRAKLVVAANTDDRGMYRMRNLGPGRYVLITSARVLEDGRSVVPTFYGHVTGLAQAKVIDVALDNELSGFDISPIEGRLNTIRGQVNAAGILAVQMLGDLGMQEVAVRADGSFEFAGIPSGSYSVVGSVGGAAPLSAAQDVMVQGEDRFVSLKFGPSPVIRLQCEGVKASPGLVIFLERDRIADGQERRLDCGQALQVPAGLWHFRPLPLSGSYLQSLTSVNSSAPGRSEVFDLTVAPEDKKDLIATLGIKAATLRGKVQIGRDSPGIGVPVGLIAVSDDLNRRMGGPRLTRTDGNGAFRIDGLAPGAYRAFSSFGLDSVTAVENFGSGGKFFQLEEGEVADVEIEWQQ